MNDLWLLIAGALLASIGGGVSDEVRAARERKRELIAIKISIVDELSEIRTTVNNMNEVWTQSNTLYPKYVTDLLSNTTAFDSLRTRLFLIKDSQIRKKIIAFYKELKDLARDSEGKLGTLAESGEAKSEQGTFANKFQALGSKAEDIISSL